MMRLTQKRVAVILRDDHIGDPLGAIFLNLDEDRDDWVIGLLGNYLGPRARILKVELMAERVVVEFAVQAFSAEAERLAATARDPEGKGAPRNALALFQQALELDPLNHAAWSGTGLLLARMGHHDEALAALKRARETGPESVEVLFALGRVAVALERRASAIIYLERAFELAPAHFGVRRALTELGRKPKPASRGTSAEARVTSDANDRGRG
jgi:tetratricopeptide (TPR) repeat protein